MSGFMPYLVEKGPYLSVLESKLSQPATRAQILRDLHNGVALADLVGFDSTNLDRDNMTEAERKQHLNEDWFGFNQQPMFWVGFEGKPEIIMREGMIRAIEMSFGLEHGDPVPDDARASSGRHWPIDVYWICQGPWFQCWVLWRAAAKGEGHVTLLITTPAAFGYPLTAKITRPVHPRQAPYTAENYAHPPESRPPNRAGLEKGMWVVGHEDYARKVKLSTVRARHRDIKIPRVVWVADDSSKVECVVPAEREGGVLDDPRRYVAPVPRP